MSLSPSSSASALSNYLPANPVNIERSIETSNLDHRTLRVALEDLPRVSSAPIPITQGVFQEIVARDTIQPFSCGEVYVGSPPGVGSSAQVERRRPIRPMPGFSASSGRLDEIRRKYFQVKHDLDEGHFNFNKEECAVEYLRSSESNDYYTFSTSSSHRYTLKLFNNSFEERFVARIDSRIEQLLENYNRVKSLDITVVQIFNEQTAPADGYVVSSLMPKVLTPKEFRGKSLDALKDNERFFLAKIKHLFEIADRSRVFVQLEPGHIALSEGDELVITEFTDEKVKEEAFESRLSLQMKKWSDNPSIQQFLMSGMSEKFKACHSKLSETFDLPFDLDLE